MNECKICKIEIPINRKYCSNKCKFSDNNYNESRVTKIKNNPIKNSKCNICGWISCDYLNKSGILTKHGNIHSDFIKNKSLDELFTIITLDKFPEVLKCPLCLWNTEDVNNKSGAFTVHLNKIHNLSILEFLKNNIGYNHLWKTFKNTQKIIDFIKLADNNGIKCLECNITFRKITNLHLKKHGLTPTEYKYKHSLVTTCSKTTTKLQGEKSMSSQIGGIFDRILAHDCEPLFSIEEYTGVVGNKQYKFKCKLCNDVFFDSLDDGKFPLCRVCNPKLELKPNRKMEKEFGEFLESNIKLNIIRNDRKKIYPKEIDFYIPDLKLAIELDGLFWHSDLYKEKSYHLEKTLNLRKIGIRTIHIFEDEWNNKTDLVKNKILHISKSSPCNKIYARKCIIKEINTNECSIFLEKHHIQGKDNSFIKLGAYFNNVLVSVMTFSKPRVALGNSGKEDFLELSRFASESNSIVIGTASKIFSYFLKNYKYSKIISYADLRWTDFDKNLYTSMGFNKISQTTPGYFWCKNGHRYHRFGFTKQKLIKLGHCANKTEAEIMGELGYYRIWDCGHLKYEWLNTSSLVNSTIESKKELIIKLI